MDQTELHQLLVAWNQTSRDYPKNRTIHQLFEDQVARTPDAIALIFNEQRLTYNELNEQVNRLAHYLRGIGVGPEACVGICMKRSLNMLIGTLAVLKAGGAYVPLDPTYPIQRLTFMMQDAHVALLLTQQDLDIQLPTYAGLRLYLDQVLPTLSGMPSTNPENGVAPYNLAYLIYTSGSTGQPKGVAIEHSSAVVLLYWARETYTDEEFAGTLAATSLCFDLSVFEIFVPLSWGGTVILCINALYLSSLPAVDQVTLINTGPSVIKVLLRDQAIPSSVRTINLAGEPLLRNLVQQLYQLPGLQRIYNLYGPSEDTTYSTFALIERDSLDAPPIGRPIANTQVYVLDNLLQPVPIGEPGELYLAGEGLARGYWHQPELTRQRFVRNIYSADKQAFMYKTGDIVRYRTDGQLEFLGRLDHQVKIRGIRIEPGEIEAALSKYPAVEENLVLVRKSENGENELLACIIPRQQQSLIFGELRNFLRESLPAYMIPAQFGIVDAFPLTPNGKVDRQALLSIVRLIDHFDARQYIAPQTELEHILSNMWISVLGKKQISIHDNFFELGGNSLMAMQVISRMQRLLQVEVSPEVFFEIPTIEELAILVEQMILDEIEITSE